jgi:hypothetical protein
MVALAEWLRRVPAKYMGFPRESSNLSGDVAFIFYFPNVYHLLYIYIYIYISLLVVLVCETCYITLLLLLFFFQMKNKSILLIKDREHKNFTLQSIKFYKIIAP